MCVWVGRGKRPAIALEVHNSLQLDPRHVSHDISLAQQLYLLCYVHVSTRGCGVEGDPALIVRLVDGSSMFHQERHHVHVVIYACLKEGGREK
jgi:hypothetical protein